MKKVFVLGAYGCGNVGDDAILQSICELFSDSEICATNGRYCDVSSFLPVSTVSCRFNEGFTLSVLLSMIKDSFVMMSKIAHSDILIYGGGSLIHDLTPYNLPFLYFWHIWAKLLGKKVYYFSMGVGPLETKRGRWLSKRILSKADGLFVRDERGYSLCQELGIEKVEMSADAAFAFTSKDQCNLSTVNSLGLKNNEFFCITASQWFHSSNFWNKNSMNFTKEIDNLAFCIKVVAEKLNQPAVFVPTVFHDFSLGQELKKKLGNLEFIIAPQSWNCKEMAEIIENASFLLGVRMHSIIFAARHGIPFLALIYDEKVAQLLLRLDMEAYSIKLEQVNPENVKSALDVIIQNREKIVATLVEKSYTLCNLVRQSKDKMDL